MHGMPSCGDGESFNVAPKMTLALSNLQSVQFVLRLVAASSMPAREYYLRNVGEMKTVMPI